MINPNQIGICLLFHIFGFIFQPVDCVSKFEKSVFIRKYKNEPKFDVKGKVGGKIAQYFGIDASSIDSFTVEMNVGTVTKRELKWDVLNQLLADNTLNVDHEFVQAILGKPRRSLCIVYETVSTGSDADVDSDVDQEGKHGQVQGCSQDFSKGGTLCQSEGTYQVVTRAKALSWHFRHLL